MIGPLLAIVGAYVLGGIAVLCFQVPLVLGGGAPPRAHTIFRQAGWVAVAVIILELAVRL